MLARLVSERPSKLASQAPTLSSKHGIRSFNAKQSGDYGTPEYEEMYGPSVNPRLSH
jgi:hypothetical protein